MRYKRLDNLAIMSLDASLIYNMSTFKNNESDEITIKDLKEQYEDVIVKLSECKDEDVDKNEELKQQLEALNIKLHQLENMNCVMKKRDTKYYYKGVLSDSLMLRKLLRYLNKSDIRMVEYNNKKSYYTDVVIDLTFDDSIMYESSDKRYKKDDTNENKLIENGNSHKKLITNDELRILFYNKGFYINGNKYVNYQRSSSKSRTGNNLFILDKLRDIDLADNMIAWQRLGIEFKGKKDIVGIRAYESLVSSSIIDEIPINPKNILLIDDATGRCNEKCNVVESGTYQTTYVKKGKDGEEDKQCIRNNKCLEVKAKNIDIKMDLCAFVNKNVYHSTN